MMRSGTVQRPETRHARLISQLISLTLIFFLLFGCAPSDSEANNFDNIGFSANLKADDQSPIGKKAAYYDGRIFYLSSELGTQGIYSMDTAGKDVKMEIPVEDIRSINVRDDGIYYAGFAGIKENTSGPFRQFRLLIRNKGEETVSDYLKNIEYPKDWPISDGNVWDFYISDSGINVICFAEVGSYRLIQFREVASFIDGLMVPIPDYDILDKETRVNYESFNQDLFKIGRLGGLCFLSDSFISADDSSLNFLNLNLSIIDLNSNDHIIKMMAGSYLGYNDDCASFSRWFCRGDANGFILASVHGLEKYDIATNTVSDIVSFDQPENVYFQIDCGDNFLVFTQLLRKTYDLDYRYSNILK